MFITFTPRSTNSPGKEFNSFQGHIFICSFHTFPKSGLCARNCSKHREHFSDPSLNAHWAYILTQKVYHSKINQWINKKLSEKHKCYDEKKRELCDRKWTGAWLCVQWEGLSKGLMLNLTSHRICFSLVRVGKREGACSDVKKRKLSSSAWVRHSKGFIWKMIVIGRGAPFTTLPLNKQQKAHVCPSRPLGTVGSQRFFSFLRLMPCMLVHILLNPKCHELWGTNKC